ncbi:MAG: virulence factor [Leptolyngbya sp.]|nr:virulence factor [Candidatus Melainabacteria bacterium]
MHLKSIETTPNPNSMKLNFSEVIGASATYQKESTASCPPPFDQLLSLEGIKSIFVCQDFVTVNKAPGAAWKAILTAVSEIWSGDNGVGRNSNKIFEAATESGQVSVLVQTFKAIPIQVKVVGETGEKRIALSSRFMTAAQEIQDKLGSDFLKERYWADLGIRYGDAQTVAAEVADEIEGTIDEDALGRLVASAIGLESLPLHERNIDQLKKDFESSDWHIRLKVVQSLSNSEADIELLIRALKDSQMQVRRFAAAGLGAAGAAAAVAPLCQSLLEDTAIGVRRTAGDALSDLGDLSAEPSMCKALSDGSKLVRWRAARFLSEVGTARALPFLQATLSDPEDEVQMEALAAIERIGSGKEGSLPVWKKMQANSDH